MAKTPMPERALVNLQAFLRRQGYDLGTTGPLNDGVDGDWGSSTAKALDAFITGKAPAAAKPPAAAPSSRPTIDPDYAWLQALPVSVLPRTIWCGLQELGVKEVAGAANSPTIMAWAAEVGLQASYTADKVPWCGLFAAVIAKRANKEVPEGPLWALNWKKFGVPVAQPGLGDCLVFLRDGGGHVGWYVGEDRGTAAQNHEDAAYHVLGGNQSDAVTITRVLKKRLVAARRPQYNVQPAAVKPYIVAATGALSHNEA